MKVSKFNQFWKNDSEKNMAFNAYTCSYAEVEDDFFKIIDKLNKVENLNEDELFLANQMLEGGFLIEDFVDEMEVLKYRSWMGKFTNNSFGLTIAPTLSCNFTCPYCYETPNDKVISDEIIDSILRAVEDNARQNRSIDITWYGGEPLLAKNVIFEMSDKIMKICEKYDVSYGAYMVTNGYLLDEETIVKMKSVNIDGVQITIDGPPEIHNKRRTAKNGDDTFDRILENVVLAKANKIDVTIRVNVDQTNEEYIGELLDILKSKNLLDVSISLGHVTAYTQACQSVSDICLNTEEYSRKDIEFKKMLQSKGFIVDGSEYPFYPHVKANYCVVDSINGYVIDSEGFMYKCWNEIGNVERSVGHIKNYGKKEEELDRSLISKNILEIDYALWSPFNFEKCNTCDVLPICMGGCPYNGIIKGEPDCEKWKYNLQEMVKLTEK